MLAYLKQLGARWVRMIVGPVLAVVGGLTEWAGVLDEVPVGPYVVNVWVVGALAAVFVAQFVLWKEEKEAKERLQGQGDVPIYPRVRPTTAEVEARRAAKEKLDRGERLSRSERRILARPDLGMTRRGMIEILGRHLQLGQHDLGPIAWAGLDFQKEWAEAPKEELSQAALEDLYESLMERTGKAQDTAREWRRRISHLLQTYVDDATAARFESDAGLTPATAPKGLEDYHAGLWQQHEMRLQRLHEIIEELTTRWNL